MLILSIPYRGWQRVYEIYRNTPYYENIGAYNRRLNVFDPKEDKFYSPEELVLIAQRISNEYKKSDRQLTGLIKDLKELDQSDPVVQDLIRAAVELANRY